MQTHTWMKWAVYEGLTKTASRTFQKVVGVTANSMGATLLAAWIVGMVQVIVASFEVNRKKINVWNDPVGAFGSALFGLFALNTTILGFLTFLEGGDIATSTFIVTLSIVPGMIIDIIFFKYKSSIREWIGMAVAIIGGWAILGFPTSGTTMPLWVWLSLASSLSVAINQGITQGVKKVEPMFKNFWGGLVAVVGAPLILIAIGQSKILFGFPGIGKLCLASIVIGFIVIAMWSFNLLSYKTGASIALKKLVMNVTYLLSTLTLGAIIFHEEITIGKLTSIPLFCIALILMDKKIWEFVTSAIGFRTNTKAA